MKAFSVPRLVVSGPSGGAGKTLVSLGLLRAGSRRGLSAAPCKKGPDYIDAAWLGLAAGRPPVNLDPFLLRKSRLLALFARAAKGVDWALVEGARGLHDGPGPDGACSTAALARLLQAPVLLVLNVEKTTRTAAALVAGLASFEPVELAGVALDRVVSARRAEAVRRAVEREAGVPVLGALPLLPVNPLPERAMGLVSMRELGTEAAERILDRLADLLEENADVDAILEAARRAPDLGETEPFRGDEEDEEKAEGGSAAEARGERPAAESIGASERASERAPSGGTPEVLSSVGAGRFFGRASARRVRIGFVRDAVLWFYYEENLEALRRAGAELLELSVLSPEPWPVEALDGLYLGGGFPETFPERLAASPRLSEIRALSEAGRPVYAECGGFAVLCREMRVGGKDHPMAGVFPARAEFFARPQGIGYVEAAAEKENPFHRVGTVLRGHEFHYSRCVPLGELEAALKLSTGVGMSGPDGEGDAEESTAENAERAAWSAALRGRDGLLVRRTFASYLHLFAPAAPEWAERFAAACRD